MLITIGIATASCGDGTGAGAASEVVDFGTLPSSIRDQPVTASTTNDIRQQSAFIEVNDPSPDGALLSAAWKDFAGAAGSNLAGTIDNPFALPVDDRLACSAGHIEGESVGFWQARTAGGGVRIYVHRCTP